MRRLVDRVAVITGGAWGVGGVTARRMAEEGAKVLMADIDDHKAQANADEIRSKGGVAQALRIDVGRHEDVKAMVRKTVELWGKIDILVNNAPPQGEGMVGTALDVSEEAWDRAMDISMKSIFLGAKYAVPHMRQNGGGNIVNISSGHGLFGSPGNLVYDTAKAAVIAITRQLATDFGPWGIRINVICPGHVLTERQVAGMWDNGTNTEGLKFLEDQYPLKRAAQMVDIANAVVFLCSDEASFITGHNLVVDGGLTVQLQDALAVQQAHYIQDHPPIKLPW